MTTVPEPNEQEDTDRLLALGFTHVSVGKLALPEGWTLDQAWVPSQGFAIADVCQIQVMDPNGKERCYMRAAYYHRGDTDVTTEIYE